MTDLHGMTLPTCEICVNGQKRKLYGKKKNKVYLHNGDNFQLKFFNPLQERIGVQLRMNGIKVDNDLLVLNPGQEITIERFIGTNRKLTFSAYDIDTSKMSEERVKEAKKAIEKNGVLDVTFWNEKKSAPIIFTTTIPNFTGNPNGNLGVPIYSTPQYIPIYTNDTGFAISGSSITSNGNLTISSTGDLTINGDLKINGTVDINGGTLNISGTSGLSGTRGTSGAAGTSGLNGTGGTKRYKSPGIYLSDTDYTYFSSVDYAPQEFDRGIISSASLGMGNAQQPLSKKIETGRIEKGSVSNQHFSPIAFEVGDPFYQIKFKLLPFSLKPLKKNSMTQRKLKVS